MLTDRAARKILDGIEKLEAEYCFCDDEYCDDGYHPGHGPAAYGIAFVTPSGELDTANNVEGFGEKWGDGGQADYIVDHLETYAEHVDQLVVIELASGRWWDGPDFPG